MKIIGLQKLTLLDFPGCAACTVFTPGCNLRCPFCHNGGVVLPDEDTQYKSEEEIFAFLKKREGLLDGVAITGGEPLIQNGIEDFMRGIKKLGFKVKLDTNGAFPDRLGSILSDGLADYVAMDVKNSLEKYPVTTGIEDLDTAPFKRSIEIIKNSGVPYEFRTTVVREFHTVEDIVSIAELIGKVDGYYLQSYKESDNMLVGGCSEVPADEMRAMAEAAKKITGYCEVRGI